MVLVGKHVPHCALGGLPCRDVLPQPGGQRWTQAQAQTGLWCGQSAHRPLLSCPFCCFPFLPALCCPSAQLIRRSPLRGHDKLTICAPTAAPERSQDLRWVGVWFGGQRGGNQGSGLTCAPITHSQGQSPRQDCGLPLPEVAWGGEDNQ